MFMIYIVGGTQDGDILGVFNTFSEAHEIARKYYFQHEVQLDSEDAGICIEDEKGNIINW